MHDVLSRSYKEYIGEGFAYFQVEQPGTYHSGLAVRRLEDWSEVQNPWHPSQVSTVGLLPDGRTLGAIGCTNDRLHLFCARSHRRLSAIEGLPLGRGVGVAFSFDWRTLFVSAPASNVQDDNLLMVDLKTGNSRVLEDACRVIGHSPDGALTFLLASKGDRLHVLRHRLPLVENPQSLSDDGG